PHHGATGIAPNEFFDQVDPDYVVVPGPKWIWCGERGAQARDWVERKNYQSGSMALMEILWSISSMTA
ncbi:MAG: hypothetical protein QGG54_13340, partial [Gammaproteobacteria bacterium]|nr:hypothetical protein [Gammaproteobacteria bacterium]